MSGAVIIVLAALAAAALCALEWRRADRRHRGARLVASLVATAALAALALQPALPRRVAGARAVLATEGTSLVRAREIADSAGARTVLTLGDSASDLVELRRNYPGIGELVVAGWGLSAEELARAGNLRLTFVAAPLPRGVHSVSWPSRIVLGEEVPIRGAATPEAWIQVRAQGEAADSVQADAEGRFELHFTPRAAGLATFELRSGDAADTGAVDVRTRTPPAVLILEGTPGFELAHLRRWLARRGGKVAARTTVSRGRTRAAALNGAPSPNRELNDELIDEFDVVVIDGAGASALSAAEQRVLRTAVREDGLGLLLAGNGVRLGGLPMPATRSLAAARAVRVRRSGAAPLSPPVTAEAWTPLRDEATTIILEDNGGDAIAVWEAAGAGRIGVSAVRNPSRWTLEGDEAAYDRYWTTILASLERANPTWRSPTSLPAETDRPLSLVWPSPLDTALVTGGGRIDTLFPLPDPDSLFWSATWWPRNPGEFQAVAPGDTLRLRTAAAGGWRAARAAERVRATKLHAALHYREAVSSASDVAVPVPAWIFFGLFAAAAGWLWWERRRMGAVQVGRVGQVGQVGRSVW